MYKKLLKHKTPFVLCIVVAETSSPNIYFAPILSRALSTSRALFMVLVLQPGHRFEKKEGTRNAIGLLFACPFDCFFNAARSSAPINICIRVHIIFKKS